MEDPETLVVLVTVPDTHVARDLAQTIVSEQLAACVSCLPGVTSIYRWQGTLEESSEVQLLIKCTAARFEALRARVMALHPYTTPELLALPVVAGSAPYLAWLAASCSNEQ